MPSLPAAICPLMVHQGRRRISRICPLEVMSEQEGPRDAEVNQSDEISRQRGGGGRVASFALLLIMSFLVSTSQRH